VAFYPVKKNKIWIIKALDHSRGRTIAYVIGNSDASTFRRLYKKFEQLKDAVFYTDDWEAFKKVLPPERHIIGKRGTVTIERDNSNTRHHLGRMTRRTKVVSKKEELVNPTNASYNYFP